MRLPDRGRAPAAWALLGALWAWLAAPALAFELQQQPVTASLWTEQTGIAPDRPFTLAIRLSHAAGWHSYWQFAGDSGLPTQVSWQLPEGFHAGPLQWPSPTRIAIGSLVDYGYEGDAMLLAPIEPAAGLRSGSLVHLAARVKWLMCRDVCIPGSAQLALELPVLPASAVRPSEFATAFEAARRRVPHPRTLPAASIRRSERRLSLRFEAARAPRSLQFFPLQDGVIEASAPQVLSVAGHTVQLELRSASGSGQEMAALRGVLVADGGAEADGGWSGIIDLPVLSSPAHRD